MNKVNCPVNEIYSYQTLVKQNQYGGRRRTKRYHDYRRELAVNVRKLTPIKDDLAPLYIRVTFHVEGGVDLPKWSVYNLETDRVLKHYDCKIEANERAESLKGYGVKYQDAVIKFGKTGDDDNIVKPIKDLMEDLEIIPNDRQGCITVVEFTYNNKSNSIEIELEQLKTVVDADNIYKFERA